MHLIFFYLLVDAAYPVVTILIKISKNSIQYGADRDRPPIEYTMIFTRLVFLGSAYKKDPLATVAGVSMQFGDNIARFVILDGDKKAVQL